jgi:hypothetical protein
MAMRGADVEWYDDLTRYVLDVPRGVETIGECLLETLPGLGEVLEVVGDGEIDVEGGPTADAVDEAEGVAALQDELLHEPVIGKDRDDDQPPDLRKVHSRTLPGSPGLHSAQRGRDFS